MQQIECSDVAFPDAFLKQSGKTAWEDMRRLCITKRSVAEDGALVTLVVPTMISLL